MNIILSDSTYLVSPLYTQVPKAPVTLHRFDFNLIRKIPSIIYFTAKLPRTTQSFTMQTSPPIAMTRLDLLVKEPQTTPHKQQLPQNWRGYIDWSIALVEKHRTTPTIEYNLHCVAGKSHHRIVEKESQLHQREEYTTSVTLPEEKHIPPLYCSTAITSSAILLYGKTALLLTTAEP